MGLRAEWSSGPECMLLGLAGEASLVGSSGMDSMLLGVGGAAWEGEGEGEEQLMPDSRLMTLSMSSSDARWPLAESSGGERAACCYCEGGVYWGKGEQVHVLRETYTDAQVHMCTHARTHAHPHTHSLSLSHTYTPVIVICISLLVLLS